MQYFLKSNTNNSQNVHSRRVLWSRKGEVLCLPSRPRDTMWHIEWQQLRGGIENGMSICGYDTWHLLYCSSLKIKNTSPHNKNLLIYDSPNHLIYHSCVTLDNLNYFCTDIFLHIIRHWDTIITVQLHLHSSVHCLK